MTTIGHNRGPSMERGYRWRLHSWKKARRALIGERVPVEIVRMRVRRARDLGLDYKTYAGIRSTTGRDVIAFLFSTNALAVRAASPEIGAAEAARLAALRGVRRLALVQPPHGPDAVAAANAVLDRACAAPRFIDSWSVTRERLAALLREEAIPGDGVVVIGATALERDWCAAAKAAGYLDAERYFGG